MNDNDPTIAACYGIALVLIILLGIAVSSGVFGGQSDIEVFRGYVEGGSR
jgi:hypothetical protein